jgi:hypothetical protein
VDTDLKNLLAATEAIGDAITAGRWEEAALLEAQRRKELQAFISHQLQQEVDPNSLGAAIQGLHERTFQLIGEVDHYQRKLVREAFVARTGRQAVATYARHSSKT